MVTESREDTQRFEVTPRSGRLSELLGMAGPLIISFVSSSVMGVTDMLVVGRVGTSEQGGVGVGSALAWLFSSIMAGMASVLTTFVAQAYGAGQTKGVHKWTLIALVCCAATIPFYIGVGLSVDYLVDFLAINPSLASSAKIYTTLMILGGPLFVLNFVFISFFRGIGDTITPMYVTLGAVLLNIVADIVLVFGLLGLPELGVPGAAIATVGSLAVEAVVFSALYFGGKTARRFETVEPAVFGLADIWLFVKKGFPVGLTWFADNLSFNIMTLYIATSTKESSAAHSIAVQIVSFSMMPAIAISVAGSTLVGQYLGAERVDIAWKAARWTIRCNLALMGTLATVFLGFGPELVHLFNPDSSVLSDGVYALMMAGAFQLFDALGISTDGVFRGAGITFAPMVIRTGFMLGLFVPLSFVLGEAFDSPLRGAWAAAVAGIAVQGLVMYAWYRRGTWTRSRVAV